MREPPSNGPVQCHLELTFADEAAARAVHGALAPDDTGFVHARAEGRLVIADIEAKSPMSLLHTIEDFLACLAVAEQAVGAARR